MKKPNYNLSQGVTFKIMTDYGVSEEMYDKCLDAIVGILFEKNDLIDNTHVGHCDRYLNTRHEVFEKGKEKRIVYL